MSMAASWPGHRGVPFSAAVDGGGEAGTMARIVAAKCGPSNRARLSLPDWPSVA
jgi:hypothetical protein